MCWENVRWKYCESCETTICCQNSTFWKISENWSESIRTKALFLVFVANVWSVCRICANIHVWKCSFKYKHQQRIANAVHYESLHVHESSLDANANYQNYKNVTTNIIIDLCQKCVQNQQNLHVLESSFRGGETGLPGG